MQEINVSPKSGVGCLFLCPKTQTVMLNFRSGTKSHKHTWGLWGGMREADECPKDTLFRELNEEMGFVPNISKVYPFDIYESTDKKFRYYSFVCVVDDEFVPVLNRESDGFAWVKLGVWPMPLHTGVKCSFNNKNSLEKLHLILSNHKDNDHG